MSFVESAQQFIKKVNEANENDIKEEFDNIKNFKGIENFRPTAENCRFYHANQSRNRFKNIFCLDESRVKLQSYNSCGGTDANPTVATDEQDKNDRKACQKETQTSDYVHANFVPGLDNNYIYNERQYIATQGPNQQTTDDIWKLALQNKVSSIVMLCGLFKEGQHPNFRCASYFPGSEHENQPLYIQCGSSTIKVEYLQVLLKNLSCEIARYRVSLFDRNSDSNEVKQTLLINHCWFKSWSNLNRIYPKTFKEFILDVNKFDGNLRRLRFMTESADAEAALQDNGGNDQTAKVAGKTLNHPIMVHCAAGAARTSSYIHLDQCMKIIALEKGGRNDTLLTCPLPKFDDNMVYEMAVHLRKARAHSIDFMNIYRFLYEFLKRFLLEDVLDMESS